LFDTDPGKIGQRLDDLTIHAFEEMAAVETALAEDRADHIPKYLTDRWLADTTLYGPAAKVREGVGAWRAAGVSAPILVPNSIAGNQITALQELFAAFAG